MDYRSLVHNMYDPDARRRAEEGLVLVTIPEGYSCLLYTSFFRRQQKNIRVLFIQVQVVGKENGLEILH